MKVLIADDEDVFRVYLKRAVLWEEYGDVSFYDAMNGKEALALAEQVHPDLVLADIEMPLMNGLEFSSGLKRINPDCEILIITGHEKFEYAQTALRIGIADFLLKPLPAQALKTALTPIISRIQERKATKEMLFYADGLKSSEGFIRKWGKIRYQDEKNGIGEFSYPFKENQELANALRVGDRDGVNEIVDQLIAKSDREHVPLDCLVSLCLGLVTVCLEVIHEVGMVPEKVFPSGFMPYSELKNLKNSDEVLKWLKDMCFATIQGTSGKASSRIHKIVSESRRIILNNYSDPDFNVEKLSKEIFFSERYLRRAFNQLGEDSPSAYLKMVRMESALTLLNGGKTPTDTSILVGFNDPAYFSKCFKQYFGYSPSCYEEK
ncbi:response regulator [Lachnospiraceae bacterium ZAX-1]